MKIYNKVETLEKCLSGYGRVAVCFSGGVDSTFLVKTAVDLLGNDKVLALLADTPSMPRSELDSARKIATSLGVELVTVLTCEIDDPVYISNPVDRCYHCKRIIFASLIAEAEERGFETVLDGNNFDDAEEYRPGHKAAVELGVVSPLMKATLTKGDIRELSRSLGLPTADKPSLACLATRVPAGQPITRELLAKIEVAEQVLWDAGFVQVRVRDHGDQARLEISADDFVKMADEELRSGVVEKIKAVGYSQVSLNLDPLQRK